MASNNTKRLIRALVVIAESKAKVRVKLEAIRLAMILKGDLPGEKVKANPKEVRQIIKVLPELEGLLSK